jgi:RND family efflux transporter MFP subunit
MYRISLVTALVLALTGCSATKNDSEKKEATPPTVVKGVTLETMKTASLPDTLEVVGTVRSRTSAVVSARVPGTITVLKVREGERVTKGQLLIQLEARENQFSSAAADAGLDETRRALEEARARKNLADATFERYNMLFTEQAVTRQEFEVKQTEKELAAQGVARAEARLKQSREAAQAAGTLAGYTRIVAPISGIITTRQADVGSTVFPAQPLMTIEDEGNYQLELALPESIATKVRPGTLVQVSLDSVNSSFTAKIAEIVPSADPASRTFIAKIGLSQKGVTSGMFGRGAVSLGTVSNGMLAAKKSVVERGALTSVWVVDSANIARMRLVRTGKIAGDRVEILSGLSDGERVVVTGVEKVSEGAKVE